MACIEERDGASRFFGQSGVENWRCRWKEQSKRRKVASILVSFFAVGVFFWTENAFTGMVHSDRKKDNAYSR
jgi:hypothetical protein